MRFTARSLIEGNEVSFNMEGSNGELIIRAQIKDSAFELVAPTHLAEDFPLLFSLDYHHWINLETGVVEFRPLGAPWTLRKENWCLRPAGESTYTMERYTENQTAFLVDGHSLVFQSILGQLRALEDARYIHVSIFLHPSRRFLVELPRMKLTFFVNEDQQLESDNFRGLVVDESQSTGTMLGFHNQLVLRAKDPVAQSLPRSRCVLIPYGDVKFSAHDGHVQTSIDLGSNRHIIFYQYKIDTDLGCLTSSVGLTSRLFKIYLHAVTSYCLPDPLTGRTGTEEALHELSESTTLSFDDIDVEQARLLKLIGELTPKRDYYPVHLQSMMTTHWQDISPLAQHFAFGTAANVILDRARSLQLFNSSSFDPEPYMAKFNTILLERVAYRTRPSYPLDAAIRLPTIIHGLDDKNQVYTGRDSPANGWTEAGQVAAWASNLIRNKWGTHIFAPYDLARLADSWDVIQGPSRRLTLTYSSDWLLLSLPDSWISLYNLCQATTDGDRYKLCCCLASAAYSDQLPRYLVPVLLAFATNPCFINVAPPTHPSYHLSDGYKPGSERIRAILTAKARGLANTPASQLPKNQNESNKDWTQRQRGYYRTIVSELAAELTGMWIDNWPNALSAPAPNYSLWFDVAGSLEQARLYFKSCSRNQEFLAHLREVENALSSRPATDDLTFHPNTSCPAKLEQQLPKSTRFVGQPHLEELMKRRPYPELSTSVPESTLSGSKDTGPPTDTTRLKTLLADFRKLSTHPLHQ
ncbi:hypothetical protein FRC08_014526, partial [Ceratobasidium sp. 394]